jgi:diguanylate cyclase (GGDEF)-like protein/PAS domain S-box-containing protein
MSTENEVVNASVLLEKIFSSLYGMVAYLDRDFNFIRVNLAYANADGKKPEEFVGKNHFELYPHPENEAIFRRVVETGEPYIVYSKPFEYPDAPERGVSYWDWTLTPVHDAASNVDGLLLTLHDVTERVRAEEAKHKSEERFRLLFDNTADAIFFLDMQGHFLEVNEVACRRLGYSRDELLNMGARDINDPEGSALFAGKMKELFDKGRMLTETRHVTRDGHTIPVEINARVIDYEGLSAVLSIARDITERQKGEQALRDSEANIRALNDATTESALLISNEGVVQEINDIGARRFNCTPAEMVGRNIFDYIPEYLAESRRQVFDMVVVTGRSAYHEDTRGGMHLATSIYPVLNEEGKVQRLAIFSKDVTEERHLQVTDDLLREIDSHVLHADSLEQLMDVICRELVERLEYELVWIGRKEAGGKVEIISLFGHASGYGDELQKIGVRWDETPQGRGPVGTAIRTGEKQLSRRSDLHFKPWREAAKRFGLASVYSVPLVIKGEVFGTLTLYSTEEHTFDNPTEVARITGIANRLRIASDTAMDQQQLRLLGAALSSAGSGVFITDISGRIVWVNEAFCQQSGYPREMAIGQSPRILKSGHQSDAYYAELWKALLAGEHWVAETVERHRSGTLYTVSQTITPILDNSGEISHFIAIHEDITAQKEVQERIEYLAHYDALTGMANRALFYERLKHTIALAKRESKHFALMFLDLDRFKPINDTHGHAIGDMLLQEVAKRIQLVLRESDTGARLGGDEFTVVLPSVRNEREAFLVGNKLSEAIAQPYLLEGHEVVTSASIGVALYPEHGQNDTELITAADTAMYAAKNSGRNCIELAGVPAE